MRQQNSTHKQVFVILRADLFHRTAVPPEGFVRAKEVVRSLEEAEAEVARLNALHPDGAVRYWWQASRLITRETAPNERMP